MPEIEVVSESLEDNAMVQYKGRQAMAVIKGVEDNFDRLTPIDSILFGRGDLLLHDEVADYAIPGIQLLSVLGSGIRFLDPLEIYAPKRGAKVNLANPATAFTGERLFLHGADLCRQSGKIRCFLHSDLPVVCPSPVPVHHGSQFCRSETEAGC